MIETHRQPPVAFVLGEEPPVVAISYIKPDHASDSGFFVVLSDAPAPDDMADDDGEPWCLHCLIEEHPQVGRGLDIARGMRCFDGYSGYVEFDTESDSWVRRPDLAADPAPSAA